jgi:hypothetical protein
LESRWLPRLRLEGPSLAFAVAEAFAGGGVDGEAGGEAGYVGGGDGAPFEVAGLVGSVLAQQGVDAVREVGGDRAEGLVSVASAFDNEAAVEVSELWVVLAGDVGGEVEDLAPGAGIELSFTLPGTARTSSRTSSFWAPRQPLSTSTRVQRGPASPRSIPVHHLA